MLKRSLNIWKNLNALQSTRNYLYNEQRRSAGHSKWANIKHIKAAKDAEKSKQFERFARMIRVAIQEGGSPNPTMNSQLKTVIDQAISKDMPMSTIERNIKKFNANDAPLKREFVDIKTMNKIFIVVELFSDNLARVKMDMNTIVRKTKSQGTSLTDIRHLFEEMGIIAIGSKKDYPSSSDFEEQLMEDAINCDAQEVENIDFESKTATLLCKPRDIERIKRMLLNLDYIVDDAQHVFVPHTYIQLTDDEKKSYDFFVQKLKAVDGVENHFDNVDVEST